MDIRANLHIAYTQLSVELSTVYIGLSRTRTTETESRIIYVVISGWFAVNYISIVVSIM
jgi:uncharacterized protein involved in outer membrane biogenesis